MDYVYLLYLVVSINYIDKSQTLHGILAQEKLQKADQLSRKVAVENQVMQIKIDENGDVIDYYETLSEVWLIFNTLHLHTKRKF